MSAFLLVPYSAMHRCRYHLESAASRYNIYRIAAINLNRPTSCKLKSACTSQQHLIRDMAGLLPSASISKTCWNSVVYEPSDDTFLLTDALEKLVLATWPKNEPNMVVEIGCGSGFVICSAALMLKHEGITPHKIIAVDHSEAALAATRQTLDNHEVEHDAVQLILGDLTTALPSDVKGNIDLLLFNPPYVPTPDSELEAAATGVASTWAGGHAGRRVIDRLLPQLPSLLSPGGQMLMITVTENQPHGIIKEMEEMGLKGEIYAVRQADEESLQVLRIYKPTAAELSSDAVHQQLSSNRAGLPRDSNGGSSSVHQTQTASGTNVPTTVRTTQQAKSSSSKQGADAPITIQYMSDLHLELFPGFRVENAVGKYLVLAGDIGKPNSDEYLNFLRHCTPMFERVFVVLGNHEYYRSSLEQTSEDMETMLAHADLGGKVTLLNRSSYTFPGDRKVRVVGCTLWTEVPPQDAWTVGTGINDYRYIKDFSVSTSNALHYEDSAWLKAEIRLAETDDTKLVVVTHHAPMFRGTSHPRHADSELASAFATDLRELIRLPVVAWLYGHTHYSNVQTFGNDGVIVASNQRGYADTPHEIGLFVPERCIEVV